MSVEFSINIDIKGVTYTRQLNDLRALYNDIKEVFYKNEPTESFLLLLGDTVNGSKKISTIKTLIRLGADDEDDYIEVSIEDIDVIYRTLSKLFGKEETTIQPINPTRPVNPYDPFDRPYVPDTVSDFPWCKSPQITYLTTTDFNKFQ